MCDPIDTRTALTWRKVLVLAPIASLMVDAVGPVTGPLPGYVRGGVLALVVAYYLMTRPRLKLDGVVALCGVYLAYTLFLALGSSDYAVTLPGYAITAITMALYLAGYNAFSGGASPAVFSSWALSVPAIFIANVVLLTSLGMGEAVYGGMIYFGNLHDNRIHFASLVVVMAFVLLKYMRRRALAQVLLAGLVILIILSLRRTAIGILAVGVIMVVIMTRQFQVSRKVIVLAGLVIMALPLYAGPLTSVVTERGYRATLEQVDTESRVREVRIITARVVSFDDPLYSLFGMEYLNSFGTYATAEFPVADTRVLHADYAAILHGAGLIGLFIYLSILLAVLFRITRCGSVLGYKHDVTVLLALVWLVFVVGLLSGGLLNVTLRSASFIALGALMRMSHEALRSSRRRDAGRWRSDRRRHEGHVPGAWLNGVRRA